MLANYYVANSRQAQAQVQVQAAQVQVQVGEVSDVNNDVDSANSPVAVS